MTWRLGYSKRADRQLAKLDPGVARMIVAWMAKNVDGIYDSDPKTNPDAKKYENMTYSDIINRRLKVIDFTAATMCMENNVPTLAFGLDEENSIVRAVCGETLGTVITV